MQKWIFLFKKYLLSKKNFFFLILKSINPHLFSKELHDFEFLIALEDT